MKQVILSVGSVFLLMIVMFTSWRYASRKRELPCPVRLRWFVELDDPYTKNNRSEVIMHRTNIQQRLHVIDVPYTPLLLTLPLAEPMTIHARVTAVDHQAHMIQLSKQTTTQNQLSNIEVMGINICGCTHHREP